MSAVSPSPCSVHIPGLTSSCTGRVGAKENVRSRARDRGAGGVEFLVALPVMLLLGLLIWQWGLVMQARAVVDYAAREAARSGALGHASPAAVEQGMTLGLSPLWVSNSDLAGSASAFQASAVRFGVAAREGWLSWRQLSPTQASFDDWGTPFAGGAPSGALNGALEIPIDNPSLRSRHGVPLPASGSAIDAAGRPVVGPGTDLSVAEPVGSSSGQTFREAGILRLELSVGVPLHVPLAGRFISWAARLMSGCSGSAGPGLGALRLEEPGVVQSPPAGRGSAAPDSPSRGDQSTVCLQFSGRDHTGRVLPRLPLRVVAEARMQSAARVSNRTPSGPGGARQGAMGGAVPVVVHPAAPFGVDDSIGSLYSSVTTQASPAPLPTGTERLPGFLQIGGEREIWAPGACGLSPS